MTEPSPNPSEKQATPSAEDEPDGRLQGWVAVALAYLPLVAVIVVLSAATTLAMHRFIPSGAGNIVVFDVLKFVNAERAIAAKLLGNQPDTQAAVMLDRVGARADAVIREVAGRGTLVLVKQAVVGDQFRDITDEVLTRLDLPTHVSGHFVSMDAGQEHSPQAKPKAIPLGPDVLP